MTPGTPAGMVIPSLGRKHGTASETGADIPHEYLTPVENKLEDLYSIVQFSDPALLTPLWTFAPRHFNLSTNRKSRVLIYRNLDLSPEQEEIHQGHLSGLFSIMNKKILTPMYVKRMQQILLSMRMVFLSTDMGGVGLNLQNTDCLTNFELRWNPA